ncbi:hypothetical protein JHK85_014039 [Glycine max]|nr:hypothetical protein JHK85_014039 [Glycine max]KAG5058685.1 hypothetical protein JHK86_013681 [Glycine max]
MDKSTPTEKQVKFQPPKSRILKEKRAKLYIIRRCIVMLLCWKENGDHGSGQRTSRSGLSAKKRSTA